MVYRLGAVGSPADRGQELPCDPVGRRASLGERAASLTVPGGPHRGGYFLVQRLADERMTEPQAAPGLGQHAGGPGLFHRRDEVRDAAVEDGGQVGHRELHAEQGSGAEHLSDRGGDETEPVRDRRRQ